MSEQLGEPLVVTAFGGGHGLSAVMEGARFAMPEARINGIVTMTDNGGSSGRLSELYGIQPVGDVSRNVLSCSTPRAAAGFLRDQRFGEADTIDDVGAELEEMLRAFGHDDDPIARKIADGTLELARDVQHHDGLVGHSLRNLTLGFIATKTGNMTEAARQASILWRSSIRTLPVTHNHAQLVLRDGEETIVGESKIDEYAPVDPRHISVGLDRRVLVTDEVEQAILTADALIVAPGSLTTSVLASLAPLEIPQLIQRARRAPFVVIPSPVHHAGMGETKISGVDWVRIVQHAAGRIVDRVILDPRIPRELSPITCQSDADHFGDRADTEPLLREASDEISPSDALAHLRSKVSFDPRRIGALLHRIASDREPSYAF